MRTIAFLLLAAAPAAASEGTGKVRLLLADPAMRSGRPWQVVVSGAVAGRGVAVLASPRSGPTELPPAGTFCLGPPVGPRNVLGVARADDRGVATVLARLPRRDVPEGRVLYVQGVARDASQGAGYAITPALTAHWTPDSVWVAAATSRSAGRIDLDGGLVTTVSLAPWVPRRLAHDARSARLYILAEGNPWRLVVIETIGVTITRVLDLPSGFQADAIALSASRNVLYLLDGGSGRLVTVDPNEVRLLSDAWLPAPVAPCAGIWPIRTPAEELLILPHALRLTAAVLDPASLSVVETVDLDPGNVIDPLRGGTFTGPRAAAAVVRDGAPASLLVVPTLLHSPFSVAVAVDLRRRPLAAGPPSERFLTAGPVDGLTGGPSGVAWALDADAASLHALIVPEGLAPIVWSAVTVEGSRPGLVCVDAERLVAAGTGGVIPISVEDPVLPGAGPPVGALDLGEVVDVVP
jgi:hypothetical protein